jgi:hypothetical protein
VDVKGPDECWLWTACTNGVGYGRFGIDSAKRTVYAHRLGYFLEYGVDPGNLMVCHKCDQPLCQNPRHLFLGTKGDNNRDSVAKGRHAWKDEHLWRQHPEQAPRGERNGCAKLTEADVIEIRRLYAAGWLQREIGEKFGVRNKTVSKIVRLERWKHLP